MPLDRTGRVSRGSPCPICHKADWCLVAKDERYAICMRTVSDRPAQGKSGGWIHRLAGYTPRSADEIRMPRKDKTPEVASIEQRDYAYRRLQDHARLGATHHADLLQRGYSPDEIKGRGYRTLPLRGRAELAKFSHNGDCNSLHSVPGFYLAKGQFGPYWSVAGSPGLLIPCHDPAGRIRGYRIRPDEQGDGGKYRWLSSAKKPGGIGSGVHCHVAKPLSGAIAEPALWITEGEVKADLAAERLGAVVISIPGVSCWAQALPDVAELLPDGGRIVVALDADWRNNPAVHQAAWNLCQAGEALGYGVDVATWDVAHKGLDDLLIAGLRPTLHAKSQVGEPPWILKLSTRILADAPQRRQPPILTVQAMRELIASAVSANCLSC